MGLDFNAERWLRIKENYRRWWAGELKRPLIQLPLSGREPGRPAPKIKARNKTAGYEFSIPAEAIVDRWDYELSRKKFLGDSFPCVWPDFGAGVLAAFLGAKTRVDENTVWFHPPKEQEAADIHFKFNGRNEWYQRIVSLCRAAMERWQGLVQCSMTDLGGNLDILSTFRPGEQLPLDLYDHPAEVKRLTWEAHEMWWRYFDKINQVLQPLNPGYTAWTQIYSPEPYYMLQCDFCYMLSPEMFDEFVKPELQKSCARLKNAFYHLDGKGELPHLDSLLAIKELKGVQWIPGDGQPDITHWPEVYRKIRAAGKLIQIFGGEKELDALAAQLGSAEGLIVICRDELKLKDERQARAFLKRYGAE